MIATHNKPDASTEKNEARSTGQAPLNYTSNEAREFLRYDDRKAFLDAVHRDGIPHIRVNQRKLLFPSAAFHAWLDRRRVGRAG